MAGNPYRVNWRKLEEVKAYADELGPGQVVIKVPGRDNYNITFKERTDRYQPEWVVYSTDGLFE
jgi:hypothetical protein